MNRELDGCYFRIQREGHFENVCFSDLTAEERDTILDDRSEKWLKSFAGYMAGIRGLEAGYEI